MTDTPIWMPLNVADFIKDTQHLSPAERGAYMSLICHAWLNDGAIVNDPKRVFRLTGLSPREWAVSRDTILEFFTVVDGSYRQKRVDQELEKARKLIEQKRAAGKASAAARSERAFNGRSTGVATAGQREGNQLQSQGSVPTEQPGVDLQKRVFDEGAALLVRCGSSPGAARSFIGKCRQAATDAVLSDLIAEAIRCNITEPKAWLTAAIQKPANEADIMRRSIERVYGDAAQAA